MKTRYVYQYCTLHQIDKGPLNYSDGVLSIAAKCLSTDIYVDIKNALCDNLGLKRGSDLTMLSLNYMGERNDG